MILGGPVQPRPRAGASQGTIEMLRSARTRVRELSRATEGTMTETLTRRIRGKFSTATVVRWKDLTDDLWLMWLKTAIPFNFKPGQYITIGVDGIERPYSIASSPSEPEIELFIEVIPLPDGELTPLLYDLNIGDEVTIRPRAKGLFLFDPEFRNHVMVATVTGVTPFISMLRAYFENPRGGDRFYILEGASYWDEFGYHDELRKLAEEREEVVFVPTVSRPSEERNAHWKGETGRVNTLVEKYLEEFGLQPHDTIIYLCGHPLMIEDVKGRLDGRGFKVDEERFWKEEEAA